LTIQEILGVIVSVITILSFIGGVVIFLFRKIVISPLQVSIDNLNSTLKEFKLSTDKRLELVENRVDIVEDKTTRHETQINFLLKGGEKHV
jgi:hypothetical protein